MKTEIGDSLVKEAVRFAEWLSTPKGDYPNYRFIVKDFFPLSESVACVKYQKEDNGEQALAKFEYSDYNNQWRGKVVKHSDAEGYMKVMKYLDEVEKHNFKEKHDNKWKTTT